MDIELLDRMSISAIETFFDKLLRGKLTDNLFFEDKLPAMSESWTDFVVVDCMNPIRNHDSHAIGTVLIRMYAKQSAKGTKNVKTMSRLEKTLNRLVNESEDEYYHISHRGMYADYDAVNDIFFNIIQIQLIIT